MRSAVLVFALLAVCLTGCDDRGISSGGASWEPPITAARAEAAPEARESCAHRLSGRQAFFGDLHVHTGLSMDARVADVIARPDDAYRHARGEVLALPGGRTSQLDRPLDFAAVTDHAEWMAEVVLCHDPTSAAHASRACRIFRGETTSWFASMLESTRMDARLAGFRTRSGRRQTEICGEDAVTCRDRLRAAWLETKAAAERWYDRSSACRFTTFHGWEYTLTPQLTNLHRNVLFRNEVTPELPISAIDTPTVAALHQKLDALCNATGSGCEALAIPHNSNLSNGQMFAPGDPSQSLEAQRSEAELRARMEPLAEIVQIKGESECRNDLFGVVGGPDEACSFEKARDIREAAISDCGLGTGSGAMGGKGCRSRNDYVRYALITGIAERERIGVNPFAFGFIGSTDQHFARSGGVSERVPPAAISWNPGGLAGVWAEENSRDALFDALKRRETFATSGPRIQPRFFGGWALPADVCARGDLVADGDAGGVPMGGTLEASGSGGRPPTFAVAAVADPGTADAPGGLLQQLQIIKVWHGRDGSYHQEVHTVAGSADNGAEVDLASCEARGPGASDLCATWTDAAYDPAREAIYYARVLENPSCRWSTRACNALPLNRRPPQCRDPRAPKAIQERAWTSPIWILPVPSRTAR